jgi:hypothetical protein
VIDVGFLGEKKQAIMACFFVFMDFVYQKLLYFLLKINYKESFSVKSIICRKFFCNFDYSKKYSTMLNPCEIIYSLSSQKPIIGNTKGICRITGKAAEGIPFSDWVKDTFTDHAYLYAGSIISNEAVFCFDEASELLQ